MTTNLWATISPPPWEGFQVMIYVPKGGGGEDYERVPRYNQIRGQQPLHPQGKGFQVMIYVSKGGGRGVEDYEGVPRLHQIGWQQPLHAQGKVSR